MKIDAADNASSATPAATPAAPAIPNSEPTVAARAAGLRYVSDDKPGIRREKQGEGFRYLDKDGKVIDDAATLARIKALVIPPAWTDVWICPLANGHLQATGRDAKQRKQYRYHAKWRSVVAVLPNQPQKVTVSAGELAVEAAISK